MEFSEMLAIVSIVAVAWAIVAPPLLTISEPIYTVEKGEQKDPLPDVPTKEEIQHPNWRSCSALIHF